LRSQIATFGGSWSSWLPYWCFAYNTTEHTQTGYTPFELVFGRTCIKPNNLSTVSSIPIYNPDNYKVELQHRLRVAWKEAHDNLVKNKEKRKEFLDQSMRIKEYKPGDQILLKKENRKGKLDDLYIGPFKVTKCADPNIEIQIKDRKQLVHKNRVKPFILYLEIED
jgi:hypothetical protein